jgi:ABC-type phosphate/phosphonate transport system substrate-binding protein
MIANARMYSVTPAAAAAWRGLLLELARRAGEPLQIVEQAALAGLSDLWARQDMGAVFMCGLPFSRAHPQPHLVAAPVPSPKPFEQRAEYWSEFVVALDSPHRTLPDTFGGRLALTSVHSQSGFAAPLRHLAMLADRTPLFAELIAPQVNPQGALTSVADGRTDVAPVDSYSLHLMRRYNPALVARVRVVDRTPPRPIPALVASAPSPRLSAAFLSAHDDGAGEAAAYLRELLLERFILPSATDYEVLSDEFDRTLAYWRSHRLADRIDPTFQSILAA